APVAIKVAAGAAARRGLVIRNAAAFETLVAADVVAFDKTGTLTYGKPQVVSVEWNEKLSHAFGANASRLAGALNQSSHPLSKALLSFLEGVTRRSTPPLAFDEHPGKGFQAAFDDGAVVTVGNARWMRENRINTPLEDDRKIYAAVNTEIWAAFVVQDAIKAEAAQTVQTFKSWGVETVLLTGDHVENTQPVAEAVGIDRFEARLLPAQKAERIRQMQANGKVVVMVGDGVNDAPAFATANVGAAMGNGSQLAVRHADIVVMGGDLRKLVFLFRLARKTRRIVLQNVVWALGYNVVVLPTALGIFHPVHLSPGAAGGLMALSSLVVVLNGLRIKFFKA
ncbi:MAG: HAD-IC family P-type ATPase, partial [Bacteroidia bacterium]|nr:HAD-IC family P-type ATPase [Bacteroidia bacterium]MDW8333083.1 HAD-IC family P-type ATPase [Bacteroidia bacterium]